MFAILSVLATWAVTIPAVVGWGRLFRFVLATGRRSAPSLDNSFIDIWLGYAGLILVCQIWHLVLPIDSLLTVLVVSIGWIGVLLDRQGAVQLGKAISSHRGVACACLGVMIWVAHWATGPCVHYDSLMYHALGVRWAHEFRIVPGLANLQHNHGYNTANLLVDALFCSGPWGDRAFHVARGWLVAAFAVRSILGIWRFVTRQAGSGAVDLYYALTLPMTLNEVTRFEASSYSSDLVAGLLMAVIGGQAVALLAAKPEQREVREASYVGITILSAAVVCVKLSSFVFAVSSWALALAWYWRDSTVPGRRRLFATSISIAAGLMLIFPWSVRGVILSGYVGYPATVLRADYDWTVPLAQCDAAQRWIRAYGRGLSAEATAQENELRNWFPSWLRQILTQERDRILLPGLAVVVCFLASARSVLRQQSEARRIWLALLPAVAGGCFWMWGSPSPRFGYPHFSIAFSVVLCGVLLSLSNRGVLRRASLVAVCIVPLLYVTQQTISYFMIGMLAGERPPISMITTAVSLGAPPEGGYWPTPPSQIQPFVTRHGVRVWIPKSGGSIWDAPLPASHYRTADLRLRVPGDLQGGFRISSGERTE